MNDNITPCPFCGYSDRTGLVTNDNYEKGFFRSYVVCDRCSCEGPPVWGENEQKTAIMLWNRRNEKIRKKMYLLKIERKNDKTKDVEIGPKFQYREFKGLESMIRHVFDNVAYIKDYTISRIVGIEDEIEGMESQKEGHTINLKAKNSYGDFY